jgi:peptidoglycan/LPS O-acetylase OafA/YrhL
MGQVLGRLQEWLALAVENTPAQAWTEAWFDSAPNLDALTPASEVAVIALGLLAPCLIAFTITRDVRRRIVMALGAAVLGLAATTLSTALNFGPQHALAWRTPSALGGFALGAAIAVALAWLPRRAVGGLALVVLTAGIALVSQAPADPYFAESLQGWEQGRFIRFHGAAQWVGWLWPYAALLYLLLRLGSRDEG